MFGLARLKLGSEAFSVIGLHGTSHSVSLQDIASLLFNTLCSTLPFCVPIEKKKKLGLQKKCQCILCPHKASWFTSIFICIGGRKTQ